MKLATLVVIFGILSVVNCDCWWTGCQLHTWAVVGCGHYGRVQTGRRPCHGGYSYNCCTPESSGGNELIEDQDFRGQYADCWWTGCQLFSWKVTGCSHYRMRTVNTAPCSGGKLYHCCPLRSELIY